MMRTETAAATMNDTRPLAETWSVINERSTFSPGTDSSIKNQRADKGYGGINQGLWQEPLDFRLIVFDFFDFNQSRSREQLHFTTFSLAAGKSGGLPEFKSANSSPHRGFRAARSCAPWGTARSIAPKARIKRSRRGPCGFVHSQPAMLTNAVRSSGIEQLALCEM
jgi:hypothetical protein